MIDKIMNLRNKDKSDWWLHISSEEKKSIEKGIEDADKGRLTSHDEVKKNYDKWL